MDDPASDAKCPVCEAPRVQRYRPFCSKRCAEIDLGRWFSGAYAIPTQEVPDDFDSVLGEPDRDEEGR